MIYRLGPRGRRVYEAVRERIRRGDLPPGTKLPSHRDLAVDFGVAPMTVRQVLGLLEAEGLVSRQIGRGTFVRASADPTVLVVDDEESVRLFLSVYISAAGLRAAAAAAPGHGLAVLTSDPSIALVMSSLRLPTVAEGTEFIRAVRRRWPELPLAALCTYPEDLAGLHGATEWPVLIIPKPPRPSQIQEVLRLALRSDGSSGR